ncbi:hypothetical protein K501DRAFT_184767, partial [Backusella circina FSU 941]
LRKKRRGEVGRLWKVLQRRESNGVCIVTTIDEYYTSQVRSICSLLSLKEKRGFKVLQCNGYKGIFDRDINAAKNIIIIALKIWKGARHFEIYKSKKSATNYK